MSREGEAYMPRALVERVLEAALPDVVLVGGQSLAYWMGYYDIRHPGHLPAISRDVDFYTNDAANTRPLERFAQAIDGRAHVRSTRALSALVGSAVAPAEDERIYNVDLFSQVMGLTRERIEANAVTVMLPGSNRSFRVLHPLDVLVSRCANLHQLDEKKDAIGQLQLELAIDVVRCFLEAKIDDVEGSKATAGERERTLFDLIEPVSDYSKQDAARKNAERYGLFVADAIPAWRIGSSVFWRKQWPHLRVRMSEVHAARCEARAQPGRSGKRN